MAGLAINGFFLRLKKQPYGFFLRDLRLCRSFLKIFFHEFTVENKYKIFKNLIKNHILTILVQSLKTNPKYLTFDPQECKNKYNSLFQTLE